MTLDHVDYQIFSDQAFIHVPSMATRGRRELFTKQSVLCIILSFDRSLNSLENTHSLYIEYGALVKKGFFCATFWNLELQVPSTRESTHFHVNRKTVTTLWHYDVKLETGVKSDRGNWFGFNELLCEYSSR